MNTLLNSEMADVLAADRLREAERFRRSRVEWSAEADRYASVTVRFARPGDADKVLSLAERDGRRVPLGPMLVAEVDGELLAARSLIGGSSIADPFRPTAHLVELLELRSAHLRNGADGNHTRRFSRRSRREWLRGLVATT